MFTPLHVVLMLAGAAIVWGLLRAAGPPVVFSIELRNGQPRVKSGRVPADFLCALEEIAEEYELRSGRIEGRRVGEQVRLSFSRQVPASVGQKLRNVWVTG